MSVSMFITAFCLQKRLEINNSFEQMSDLHVSYIIIVTVFVIIYGKDLQKNVGNFLIFYNLIYK